MNPYFREPTARTINRDTPKPTGPGGPQAARHPHMARSIVPGLALLCLGLVLSPADVMLFLFAMTGAGWMPVVFGFVKNLIFKNPTAAGRQAETLPHLTILIPLYEEANMLAQISTMLRAIDYPAARLDCLILLEIDDEATILQAMKTAWPDFVRIVTVPYGAPRTKARACNYGLRHSTGDLVVIFDAEDKPHPLQMREAAHRFQTGHDDLACLQAPLIICPQAGNWLEAQFALEYALLFTFILPNLSHAMRCLPLGGSSNYFRRSALEKTGGWDAYNLTEDAELAMRFLGHGYRIETLTLGTLENAPHKFGIWHTQRTRWQSGHIQILHAYGAWLLRHGFADDNAFKWRFIMFAYLAVLSVRLISGPLFMLSVILFLAPINLPIPPVVEMIGWGFIGFFSLALLTRRRSGGWGHHLFLVLSHPIYWMVTLIPLANALWRMASGQLNWLKSKHRTYPKTVD